MPRYTSEAIILHTTDFLESDKIVHALTREQGLISAIAKGAHRSTRRFPGTLEPFCEVTLEVHQGRGTDLQRIESASLINANLGIREDLSLIGYSSVLLEVVKENLGPYDPSPAHLRMLTQGPFGYGSLQAVVSTVEYLHGEYPSLTGVRHRF